MANVLKMAMIETIQQLHAAHWSQRRIARALGIDRKTVARYLKQVADFGNSPTGSAGSKGAISPGPPAPTVCPPGSSGSADSSDASKGAISPAGSAHVSAVHHGPPSPVCPPGRKTACEPFREVIVTKLEQRLSAQRIWQDLVADHEFTGQYDSVKRFVRRLGSTVVSASTVCRGLTARTATSANRHASHLSTRTLTASVALGESHGTITFDRLFCARRAS